MSEPIDPLEELAGYVRDLREAVENAGPVTIEADCNDACNSADRADLYHDVDDGFFELVQCIRQGAQFRLSLTRRRVLGCFVSAIENLLELEASLR